MIPLFLRNLSLRYKIIGMYVLIVTVVAGSLGYYSFKTSEKQIINKVSASNQSIITLIDNNLAVMQRSISDWITVFSLSELVQSSIRNKDTDPDKLETKMYSGTMSSLMNQMLVTGNFDFLSLYGSDSKPIYQVATDDSSGGLPLDFIRQSNIYNQVEAANGASTWFPLTGSNNVFIEDNRNEKIGTSRVIRSTLNGRNIGLIFVAINTDTIRKHYLKNLYDKDHGIAILDQKGNLMLTAGKNFYQTDQPEWAFVSSASSPQFKGSRIIHSSNQDYLLSYSQLNSNGWLILYAVPLDILTQELNSIKLFVVIIIAVCLLLSIPLMTLLTNVLVSPIKKLLQSMQRFQNGQFNERVDIPSRDEIGLLSKGYNTMVSNIKTLVDEVYILQLKEQEAELKALQSQINPHFLYNMLDTIFWEAETSGQHRISEMVINLSRLFRLSLNRGKSFTSVSKERELIYLYLTLQHMRFGNKLKYEIDIPETLDNHVILKLSLQPFIENALVHGIERKREGGTVTLTGRLTDDYLYFCITDDGVGMDEETMKSIQEVSMNEEDIYVSGDLGGYAVSNVIQRLKLYYKDNYELHYDSAEGEGTKVEMKIPIMTKVEEEFTND